MDPAALSLAQCVGRTALAVDVPSMLRSLAALGRTTVDLLSAVRLHTGCSLREARAIVSLLAPAVQEFEPGSSVALG